MGEREELYHVRLLNIAVSEGAKLVDSLPEYLDLTDTLTLTVRTYTDHEWKVAASKPIARYIHVENQIGEAELDLETRNAIVYVAESQSLAKVRFLDMKLEPEGSEVISTTGTAGGENVTEKCSFPMTLDCVHGRTFLVEYDGAMFEWAVKVLKKKVSQQISSVDAWCWHAKVYGLFSGSGNPALEYRKSADTEWSVAEDAVVEIHVGQLYRAACSESVFITIHTVLSYTYHILSTLIEPFDISRYSYSADNRILRNRPFRIR